MADVGTHYTGVRSYANERHIPKLISRLYSRSPILGIMAHKGGGDSGLRAGGLNLIGGGSLSTAQRKMITGSYEVHLHIQSGDGASDQTKNMGVRDTAPSMTSPTTDSQDQQKKTVYFRFTKKHTEVIIWNTTTELGKGKYALGSAVSDAVSIAMQHHFGSLIDELWKGSPADQTADVWSEQAGINDICHTTNTYGGLDRTSVTFFDGFRDATSRASALSLVDTAHLDLVGSNTQSVMDITDGFSVGLWNRDAYQTAKAEALSKNGTLLHRGTPEAAREGIKNEAFFYGNVLNTYDPGLKDYSAVSGDPDLSGGVLLMDPTEMCFLTQEGKSFSAGPFRDLAEYSEGGKDAIRSLLKTHYKFWTFKPFAHFLYTAVSA